MSESTAIATAPITSCVMTVLVGETPSQNGGRRSGSSRYRHTRPARPRRRQGRLTQPFALPHSGRKDESLREQTHEDAEPSTGPGPGESTGKTLPDESEPAEPPTLETALANWNVDDMIYLGRRTLGSWAIETTTPPTAGAGR